MRHQASKDLYAYWDSLRGDRVAPDRAEIDLLAIRHLLADTFIIEEAADGAYPLRVAGARLDALWGQDRKGVCFTDLWRSTDRLGVVAMLQNVVEGILPIVASARLQAPGDARVDLELLLLPLRRFGGAHTRIIGALTPLQSVDWLAPSSATPLEMRSLRCIAKAPPPPARILRQPLKLVVYNGSKC